MRGMVVFYISLEKFQKEESDSIFNMVRQQNKDLIIELEKDGYKVAFVPVSNESCRVEKIDFETNISTSSKERE